MNVFLVSIIYVQRRSSKVIKDRFFGGGVNSASILKEISF